MELVAALLRDDVHDAAGVPAVLGLVAAGLDLDLLHELGVDRLALEPLDDVRRVDAVDQEEVLGRGGAVDREGERPPLGLAVVLLDTGLLPDDVGVVPPERQLAHHGRRVGRTGGRRGRVDDRRLTRHDDLFLDRHGNRDRDGRRAAEGDSDVRLLGLREAREGGRDGVDARGNRRELVAAGGVGDDRPGAEERRRLDVDGDARKRPSVRVGNGALDGSGGLGEGRGADETEDDQERERRDGAQPTISHPSYPPNTQIIETKGTRETLMVVWAGKRRGRSGSRVFCAGSSFPLSVPHERPGCGQPTVPGI